MCDSICFVGELYGSMSVDDRFVFLDWLSGELSIDRKVSSIAACRLALVNSQPKAADSALKHLIRVSEKVKALRNQWEKDQDIRTYTKLEAADTQVGIGATLTGVEDSSYG